MNSIRTRCIISTAILTEYTKTNFCIHFPREIIHIIIMTYFKLINVSISCGGNRSYMILNNKVYAWGDNTNHNLPLMNKINLNNVVSISCGTYHTMAITVHNELYAWGSNNYGQLGLYHCDHRNLPEIINIGSVVLVSCGRFYTMAIITDSANKTKLYAWGQNYNGQLGLGDYNGRHAPQKVNLQNVIAVSCGSHHTMAINSINEIYAWGSNSYGQLGLGDTWAWSTPHKINLHNVISISCGNAHNMAITNLNELYGWGRNNYGQLGLSNHQMGLRNDPYYVLPIKINIPDVISASCGHNHTMALTINKEIYAWGKNDDRDQFRGQWNNCANCDTPQKINLENIYMVKCGGFHTMAITTDNKLYAWGSNEKNQLGLNDNSDRDLPEKIMFDF